MTTVPPTDELLSTESISLVDDGEVIQHIEVPYKGLPGDVRQINHVLSHPPTRRAVRRMCVYDADREDVLDTEVGLIGSHEVYRVEYDDADWLPHGAVHVRFLDEVMDFEEYSDVVAPDEPGWALGGGFAEKLQASNGEAPW